MNPTRIQKAAMGADRDQHRSQLVQRLGTLAARGDQLCNASRDMDRLLQQQGRAEIIPRGIIIL